MFGVMNHLDIAICEDSTEAIVRGYEYSAPEYKAVEIEKVVVIRKGTEEGNPTVDLVLRDENGNKFVVMVTGRLLKSIPC